MLTVHGLLLVWPTVFITIDPASDFLRGPDGNTMGRVVAVPLAFFGGLVVITALTGLPLWRVARPIAIVLEVLCTPFNWILISVAGISGPVGLVLAGLPLLVTVILLTRHDANAWFHQLGSRQ
jgi:hypothetical protein